jgi:2-polyprenyl-3-methyl-5-hydroxy-6-metoxy-1,4-benzoquinol methylase
MCETIILKDLIKEPLQENLQTLFNHLGRYYYAMKKMNINENDTVLDVGCGQGYGSDLLSYKAKKVIAIDKNMDFLDIGISQFRVNNIEFIEYYEFIKYNFKKVDKITCIEMIEHIEKKEQKKFIQDIFKKLKENGILYITFPIGKNKPSKYNPYHKCEPSIEFVYNIVKKYFKKIEIEIDNFQNNYGHYQDYCIMVAK